MPFHLQHLAQDLRFTLRQLRRAPAFALTAVLTLALGIGATTAVFSLLDQALLRALPVRDPTSLVILEGTGTAWEGHFSSQGGDPEAYFSYPMYRDLRDRNHSFSGLVATAPANIGVALAGHAEATSAELVSGNYFTVLGVRPALGRLLTPADETAPGANSVVVLSFDFWRDHLGADPTVLGRSLSLNGNPFLVLGVAAPGFRSAVWGETPAVFVPMSMVGEILPGEAKRLQDHTDKWLNILGRLQPGLSPAQAAAAAQPLWHALRAEELQALGHRSHRFVDDFLTNSRLRVLPGARGFSYTRENLQLPLLATMAMACLVLGIASTNIASLMLVRSAGRIREFALRHAVGAGPGRITAQLLLEGLLLGALGGMAGLALAPLCIRAILHHLSSAQAGLAFTPAIDSRLLTFSLVGALVVSVLFSLAPAHQLRRPGLALRLRQTAGTPTVRTLTFRRLIVSLQIGLSVLLLVGAGLFLRTMRALRTVNAGFNTSHLVTFSIDPQLSGTAATAVPRAQQRVVDSIAALPGVQSVAANSVAQLAGDNHGGNITLAGYTPPPDDNFSLEKEIITPSYFQALQIPLLAGRVFTLADAATAHRVAIVNQAFVRHFCNGDVRSCLGRSLADGGGHFPLDTEIVGVVRDTRRDSLRADPDPTLFQPLAQNDATHGLTLYIRTVTPPTELLPTIRRTMQQLDPTLAITALRTLDMQIDDSLLNERLITLLASAFAALALVLACIGLYGVLAFTTAQRTREIGIRIALGSPRLAVVHAVLKDTLLLTSLGIGLALPVALALGHLLRSQLFGISPADPLTLIAAVAAISLVALIASLLPARRAATIDPNVALRTE